MSDDVIFYRSDNCMYWFFDVKLKEEDIRSYVVDVIHEVNDIVKQRIPGYVEECQYFINVPPASNLSKSYCYVWVSSKEVLRIMTGRNHDGSSVRNPPNHAEKAGNEKLSVFAMDWSYMEDEPEVYYPKYELPLIEGYDIPATCSQARVTEPSEEYVFGTLYCKSTLADRYDEVYLRNIFSRFNTSSYKDIQVTKTATNNAYISFPNKIDACFALLLTKKYKVREHGDELSFDYAIFKERKTPFKKIRSRKHK